MSETAQESTASPAAQDDLWGVRARDWAEIEDEGSRGLFAAVLDATAVGERTRFLDVGCGSGLACALAARRGADVSGLDASPGLLEIARERAPDGDFRLGDMQFLPWEDDTFDVVTFVNSIFFAQDEEKALREAGRVARTGARVAAVVWTSPAQVEATAYIAAIEPLLPALPGMKLFYEPAELEGLARRAGVEPERVFDVDWTWEYPDRETLLRGWLSVGLSALAIEAAGEEAVREALGRAAEPFRLTEGGYRLESLCRCLIARA